MYEKDCKELMSSTDLYCVSLAVALSNPADNSISQIAIGWINGDRIRGIVFKVPDTMSFQQFWDTKIIPRLPVNTIATYHADEIIGWIKTNYERSGKNFPTDKLKVMDLRLHAKKYLQLTGALTLSDIANKIGVDVGSKDVLNIAMLYEDLAYFFVNSNYCCAADLLSLNQVLSPQLYKHALTNAVLDNGVNSTLNQSNNPKAAAREANAITNKIIGFIVIFVIAFIGFFVYGRYSDNKEAEAKYEYETVVQQNGLTKAESSKYESIAEQMLYKSVNDPNSLKIIDMDTQAVGKDVVCVTGQIQGKKAFNATITNSYEMFIQKSNQKLLIFKIGNDFLVGNDRTYDAIQDKVNAEK